VFGKSGWIGAKLIEMLTESGKEVYGAESRLENRGDVDAELDKVKPAFVLNAAGLTGRPNVDWCEDNKEAVIRVNVVGTLGLIDACWQRGIHVTNYATGCIYEYDAEHTIGGKGFTEVDRPNYFASYYSKTKAMAEELQVQYDNVLVLRLRMPISDDLHSRSFVTKITKYDRVVDVANSMTVLHDLLPLSLDMTARRLKGVYNFTNPGAISHNEVLTLYRDIVDPSFKWKNFSLEEQAKILKAGRSNNTLDATKLTTLYPEVPEIHEAMAGCFRRMKAGIDAEHAKHGKHHAKKH